MHGNETRATAQWAPVCRRPPSSAVECAKLQVQRLSAALADEPKFLHAADHSLCADAQWMSTYKVGAQRGLPSPVPITPGRWTVMSLFLAIRDKRISVFQPTQNHHHPPSICTCRDRSAQILRSPPTALPSAAPLQCACPPRELLSPLDFLLTMLQARFYTPNLANENGILEHDNNLKLLFRHPTWPAAWSLTCPLFIYQLRSLLLCFCAPQPAPTARPQATTSALSQARNHFPVL